jgi:hypothetical protein
MKSEPRIAFVIDALPAIGGGERVLFTALEAFPNADLFTLVYNKSAFTTSPIAHRKVNTSFIDRLRLAHKQHRMFCLDASPLNNSIYVIMKPLFHLAMPWHMARRSNGARHVSIPTLPCVTRGQN